MDPLGTVDFRDKWEVESLSPISSSVSMLEVPRRFGHMGKKQPGQFRGSIKLANHLGNYVIFHRPTSIKTKGGRRVKKEGLDLTHLQSVWAKAFGQVSESSQIEKADTNSHGELQEYTSVSMVNYPCRFNCCMQIIKIKWSWKLDS